MVVLRRYSNIKKRKGVIFLSFRCKFDASMLYISAAYDVSDIETEEPPPIYDRDTTNKAEELDRLHAAMKENLVTASNTEKVQILTLVPDSWSRKYCSEYFEASEHLI